MQWQGRRQSGNVEDRRGRSGGGFSGLPGGMFTKGGLGMVVVVLLISWVTGSNPLSLLQNVTGSQGAYEQQDANGSYVGTPEEEQLAAFTKVVLADTEDVWKKLLDGYRAPTLVMFTDQVQSACGVASTASGPFYCSEDAKVYIDLSFYRELQDRFDAPGDFAQAYVIAHEVGHHVQNLTGVLDKVHAMRGNISDTEYNKLSVQLELQADFLAGVWAHHAQAMSSILEPGDIDEALRAAGAIGDDRIQKQTQGHVVPDSFTHGTSEQRIRWFRKGFDTGDINQGDTFSASAL